MDAVEFCKELSRLCSNHECSKCPIRTFQNITCTIQSRGDNAESVVEIVEQWAKEHTVRTRQSEFLRIFPDARINDAGILAICPNAFMPKEIGDEYCNKYNKCEECRKDYWLTEVNDND